MAPYFSAKSQILSIWAMVPSIENTPSVADFNNSLGGIPGQLTEIGVAMAGIFALGKLGGGLGSILGLSGRNVAAPTLGAAAQQQGAAFGGGAFFGGRAAGGAAAGGAAVGRGALATRALSAAQLAVPLAAILGGVSALKIHQQDAEEFETLVSNFVAQGREEIEKSIAALKRRGDHWRTGG